MAKTKIEEFEMDFNIYYNSASFKVKKGVLYFIDLDEEEFDVSDDCVCCDGYDDCEKNGTVGDCEAIDELRWRAEAAKELELTENIIEKLEEIKEEFDSYDAHRVLAVWKVWDAYKNNYFGDDEYNEYDYNDYD